MAESMTGMKRTCRCGEVTEAMIGQEVTLMGWVQKNRDKGGILFMDLRDRSGVIQLVLENTSCDEETLERASHIRSEYVLAVRGTVQKRAGAVNEKLSTGTDPLGGRDAAVPDRGRQPHKRRCAPEIPHARSAQA